MTFTRRQKRLQKLRESSGLQPLCRIWLWPRAAFQCKLRKCMKWQCLNVKISCRFRSMATSSWKVSESLDPTTANIPGKSSFSRTGLRWLSTTWLQNVIRSLSCKKTWRGRLSTTRRYLNVLWPHLIEWSTQHYPLCRWWSSTPFTAYRSTSPQTTARTPRGSITSACAASSAKPITTA